METKLIKSLSEVLEYFYNLSLTNSTYLFRGQPNIDWKLLPSIYRYSNLKRYQAFLHEKILVKHKPQVPTPPITYTKYDLEWLMLCQHYGIPTRLLDWTSDILTALYFACSDPKQIEFDGVVYICNSQEYPSISTDYDNLTDIQNLCIVNTSVLNPRMRMQSGRFMLWGHAPLDDELSKESYELFDYHQQNGDEYFLKRLLILKDNKQAILSELDQIYSISQNNLFLTNGFLENNFKQSFQNLKNIVRLKTIFMTESEKLTFGELKDARILSGNVENMFGHCYSLRSMSIGGFL